MRRAFTIGIDNKGDAVILKDHNTSLRAHKAGLKEVVGEFKEVFILETSKANAKKRFDTGGVVNAQAALLVIEQKVKGSLETARDALGVTPRGNPEGKVHFERASQTVAEQTGREPVTPRKRKKIAAAKKAAVPASANLPPAGTRAAGGRGRDEGQFGGGDATPKP